MSLSYFYACTGSAFCYLLIISACMCKWFSSFQLHVTRDRLLERYAISAKTINQRNHRNERSNAVIANVQGKSRYDVELERYSVPRYSLSLSLSTNITVVTRKSVVSSVQTLRQRRMHEARVTVTMKITKRECCRVHNEEIGQTAKSTVR